MILKRLGVMSELHSGHAAPLADTASGELDCLVQIYPIWYLDRSLAYAPA
jgi:hypothetical protein